jgi:hypothetical protein
LEAVLHLYRLWLWLNFDFRGVSARNKLAPLILVDSLNFRKSWLNAGHSEIHLAGSLVQGRSQSLHLPVVNVVISQLGFFSFVLGRGWHGVGLIILLRISSFTLNFSREFSKQIQVLFVSFVACLFRTH